MEIAEYFDIEQYSLKKEDKQMYMIEFLNHLHKHHLMNSEEYRKVSQKIFNNIAEIKNIADLPFLPINAFKNFTLKSIPEEAVYKIITSSGTTGSTPSRIFLDTEMAQMQTKALSKIVTHVIGKERLPMIIVDSQSVLKDRSTFSARGAGILGLSIFGKNHFYLLDKDFNVDFEGLNEFIAKNNGKKILIFGFTFMVWQYLYLQNFNIDLSQSILIHSGGWKKLQDIAVDNTIFKNSLQKKFGLSKVYNFYGMAEQVGSVFIENSEGCLHCPNYSDIIIRNPKDFSVCKQGEEGLIQVISILPKSYPGHSILTEDIGICLGEDNAQNGWKGKYFKILGRAKKAEIRGCSDTFNK
jgi:phenylacetate-coenzyme A ligase PaaK-like adenylate-forming protein